MVPSMTSRGDSMTRYVLSALVFFFALFVLPGNAFAAKVTDESIQFGGQTRTYTLHVPDNFNPSQRYPILMMLHGGGGTGEKIAKQTGIGDYVDSANFIAVFPDSIGHWNDGRGNADMQSDDVGFLVTLARQLASQYGNPGRVFVAGLSN